MSYLQQYPLKGLYNKKLMLLTLKICFLFSFLNISELWISENQENPLKLEKRRYLLHYLSEAEFKEYEPQLKFKPRIKYDWIHLKSYTMFKI